MSSKSVQSPESIGPMQGGGKKEASVDPIQMDFDKGKQHLERSELAQAAAAFHNALLGYEERGDDAGIANASNQMGHVCLAKKDYEQAIINYDRAWKICEKLGDQMSLLALSNQYVQIFCGQGNFTKAVSLCLDILNKHFDNNNPQGAVAVLEQMADIYQMAGNKEKAADAYRTIASIHSNFKHKDIAQNFLNKAADLEKNG
jgi:tetratricopeptide (TPR) repeat protein